MAREVTSTGLPKATTRTEPGIESGCNPGSESVQMRDAVYRVLQAAVEKFEYVDTAGRTSRGADALAEAMGANRGDTFLRVMRKDDTKGSLQRAFLDFLGPLLTCAASKKEFTEKLNVVIGHAPPQPLVRVEESAIGRAWLKQLESLPPGEREGRRVDMAAALGVRPEDLR